MNRLMIDSSAFDQVDLHDVYVYGFFLQRKDSEISLILDIDYLAERTLLPNNHFEYVVVPATLTFLDVVDLQIHLDWGASLRREEPYGVISSFLGEMIINGLQRFAYTDPIYTERSYLHYELDFWEPPDGRISLGARDFTIVGRQDPIGSDHLTLDPNQRHPLILGG